VPASACTDNIISIEYTGNAPDTADFHWDFGNATVISGTGPGPYEIVHPSIGNNTISLWVDGGGCSSDTTYHLLTIGESPDVTATSDDLILPYGSSTTLHGSYSGGLGPYVYEWSHPELLVDPFSPDPQTVALEFTAEFIFSVTDQAANCTGHDTVIVQVAGGPLGLTVSADPEEVCPGEQSVLTAQGMGGTENYLYSWTSNPPGFTSDLPTVTVQPITSTQYTITINDGLSEVSESVSLAVNPEPIAYAGADVIIPFGTSTTLLGSGSGGIGNYWYHWEPAGMVITPNSVVTQTINLETTTTFTLTVTDQVTGCVSETDEVIVQIDGGPLAVIIYADKPSLCQGESAVLTAFPSGGNQGFYTYTWSDNLGKTYPSTQQITVTPENTTTFHVAVNDGFNTTDAFKELLVNPSAEFAWSVGSDVIHACPTEMILLRPYPQEPGWDYLWSNGSVENEITVGVTGIGFSLDTYTLTTTSLDDCSFSRSVQVIFDFAYCSGIDNEEITASFRIMPNPGKDYFRIEWDNMHEFSRLRIKSASSGNIYDLDISGLSAIEVSLGQYPPGVYIVSLTDTVNSVSRKLVKLP
jgi:hypothetical protein